MAYIWKQKKWPQLKWQSDKLLPSLNQARFLQGELLSKIRSLIAPVQQLAPGTIFPL